MKKRYHMTWIAVMLIMGFVAVTMAVAGEQSITGKVDQTDQGIMIVAEDGDAYMVQGQDLSELVGQTVNATGTVAEDATGKILTVISIELVDE